MKQPLSYISNLFYALAGMLAIGLHVDLFTGVYAVTAALLAIGSGWYHAATSHPDSEYAQMGQQMDEVTMYGHLAALLVVGIQPLWVMAAFPFVVLAIGWQRRHELDSNIVVPVLIVLVSFALYWDLQYELGSHVAALYAVGLVAVAGVAALFRAIGILFPKYHEPAHTLWHLITAADSYCAWSLFMFNEITLTV